MFHRLMLVALSASLFFIGCDSHTDFTIDGLSASREADERVTVLVALKCSPLFALDCKEVSKVCVSAEWAEEDAASARGSNHYSVSELPRATGPALFTGETCTEDR